MKSNLWRRTAISLSLLLLSAITFGCSDRQSSPSPAGKGAVGGGLLIVSFAVDSADTFPPPGPDSVIVSDWLRLVCDSAHLDLKVKDFPFGSLIDRIGSCRNGDGGNWIYKVNGRMLAKAASACRVSPADTVLFLFK
jgi:hypothetical protein